MIVPNIGLEEPVDIPTVLSLLSEYKERAKVIAGGTDLLVELKNDMIHPELLISLGKLKDLGRIEENDAGLQIGSLATANELANSQVIIKSLPALSEAAFSMASNQIRNMATIGGNISSAVPSADLPPVLIAAEALVLLSTQQGEKTIPLHEFFIGPRKTKMDCRDLLTHIVIPTLPPYTGVSYKKFKLREANALAVASCAARLTIEKDTIKKAYVVLGAVAPIPMIARETVRLLEGKKPTDVLFQEAAKMAGEEARPISDIRGSDEYRRELIEVLTQEALKEALNRAMGVGN